MKYLNILWRDKALMLISLLLFTLSACSSPDQQAHVSVTSTAAACSSNAWTTSISQVTDGADPSVPSPAPRSQAASQMKMGPHMKMTASRTPTEAEMQRAHAILQLASICLARYKDYRLAERDGYTIFAPDVPQDVYHFANTQNFNAAQTSFDPLHPTALLYKQVGNGYQLIGIMFSAPPNLTEDQLNRLFPLGIAPWHLHINICLPVGNTDKALFPAGSPFGLEGSITTKTSCMKADGTFMPQMFGWMVHVYPWGEYIYCLKLTVTLLCCIQ